MGPSESRASPASPVATTSDDRARPEDIDFEALMRLMTSKYTVDLIDRHVGAVRKICKTCKQGFLLQHLDQLCEVLFLIVQRFGEGKREFAPAICEFARVASLPFVSCKTSDMITYGQLLPDFIKSLVNVLGQALPPSDEFIAASTPEVVDEFRLVNERIRIEVAHTLACWSRFGLDESSVELQPHQEMIQAVADYGTPNLRILQQSQVIDELAACFRAEDCAEAIVITLGAIRDMSLYRPLARQITNCGLISNLVHVIRVNLLGSDVLLVAAEVLWNILELDWEGAAVALGSSDVIESFRDFMDAVFSKGYRFKDKIFRNDMMVLLMYVAKKEENKALFASTGLMDLLLSHAVTGEMRKVLNDAGVLDELHERRAALANTGMSQTSAPAQKVDKYSSVPLTNSQEDIEFRILLWGTLAKCCSDAQCAEAANNFRFVASLLSFLDPAQAFHEQRQWSQEQRRKVQLEALSALFLLVRYTPEAFRFSDGNAIVLSLLQETTSREIQRKCLHLLQVAVTVGPEFAEELGHLGAIGALIELFTDTDTSMGSQQLCISVLAGLCGENTENCREFRKKGGIEALREEVKYRPDETTDNHLFYTLSVVDCVWCAVVGTRKNEVRFLDAGGLFGLLDVLEVAPMVLKRQIIGCLADLLQYRKAARLFTQWNSQVTMKGGLKLLLELWESEQGTTGSTGPDGVLKDLHRPLNPGSAIPEATMQVPNTKKRGQDTGGLAKNKQSVTAGRLRHAMAFSKAATGQQAPEAAGSLALTTAPGLAASSDDGSLNSSLERQDCRAKIWAILTCIGFECNEALSISERQQMELMRLYPTCVQLEAWIKLRENLSARDVKPISADSKWIEDSIALCEEQTTAIRDLQQELANERDNDEKASLERFYEDIRSRAQFRRVQGTGGGVSRTTTPANAQGMPETYEDDLEEDSERLHGADRQSEGSDGDM
eukprot:CAMPEP_0178437310 /NCGR_PEP_ID=MMETSP0689_2-20121128/34918_1 /TAXON_ID=160604 /ORGANISM="Amphidinium massartii, Strain CS-259" /LENGTH=949 /DNA_ID=CAMNT_0020059491 /DNA_START=52 /DNA_END=2901 /DNA_ORIENTATION=-